MQQTTTFRVSPWYRSRAALGAASLALALLIALTGIWAVGRQGAAPAPAPTEAQPQFRPALSPRFADEAAHAPAVGEYLSPALGEAYLPVGLVPATPAPAMPTPLASFSSPRFADEAALAPAIEEYLSPALDEAYLPVTPTIAARRFASPLSTRILADELAGSADAFPALAAAGPQTYEAGRLDHTVGPR